MHVSLVCGVGAVGWWIVFYFASVCGKDAATTWFYTLSLREGVPCVSEDDIDCSRVRGRGVGCLMMILTDPGCEGGVWGV